MFLDVPDSPFDLLVEPVHPQDIEADLKAVNAARALADNAGREAKPRCGASAGASMMSSV
jgi:hypothetical protein